MTLNLIYYNIYYYFCIYIFVNAINSICEHFCVFMFQFEEVDYEWKIPLIGSNFITILLMFFFTKDLSQQEIAFQQQIAKLEAHSLRAQMNPHFIFNALNGVQSVMMLQGEQMANR